MFEFLIRYSFVFFLFGVICPSEIYCQTHDEEFKEVEQMPRFPGCEDLSSEEAKKKCAVKKMLNFIYNELTYPSLARENGVEGVVVISFVVEKDGSITAPTIVRDIGAGCGEEALRMVKAMPRWVPGQQFGKPVRVQFNMPVKFKLSGTIKNNNYIYGAVLAILVMIASKLLIK